ncbi:MAG: 2-oxo acid dehydrogenase subunit E2 [Christensenellaceae bacterium]|jgi:pyruvate dehydrogenase E2 component (dihydrolipoamide acetyltransferase)|nr:2-oxo acid dehydrogenase subunit E2 [Christensenellaceae bacterium]
MAIQIIMPKFGLSMEEGTIGAWLVKEGDAVVKGQPIAEVTSEKLSNDANAPETGVIIKLLLAEGDTRPCGEPIALMTGEGESSEDAAASVPVVETKPSARTEETVAPRAATSAPERRGEVKITPRAEKIAKEKGLAWAHIRGTGLHGFITIDDLKREGKPLSAAPQPESTPAPAYAPASAGETAAVMSSMQKAVAKGMYQSLQQTAQTTIMTEANVQPLTEVYKALKPKYAQAGVKLSYTAMLVKAVAQALEDHPAVRTRIVDDTHCAIMPNIDIGVAVDVPGGLLVPVIRAANLKDLRAICLELEDLSKRAQTGRLNEDELGNGVITITNLGMFGITYFTPVLNWPEPCILGCGAIIQKPIVRDGGIFAEAVMNLSLTHDHRSVNGAPGARFLQQVVAGLRDFRWI